MVKELIKCSKLYNKNSPKFIINFFKLSSSHNIKNIDRDLIYKFNYLKKKSKNKKDDNGKNNCLTSFEKRQQRHLKYLDCTKKQHEQLLERPTDFNESDYRRLTIFNDEYKWVKKFQKKFHREIVKVLPTTSLPYLQSTIEHVSYATNANAHKGDRHAFIIDMANFFTQIDDKKVKKNLIELLHLNEDIADIYTKLLTSPCDQPPFHNNHYVIGQGLPSSPLLAFLCNSSFFDYLNDSCLSQNIKMTIYVDDIVFSSKEEIPQDFIDRLFTLFKKNGLSINRKKCARVRNSGVKKITGGYVTTKEVRVKNSKREEINIIFNKIIEMISELNDFSSYFDLYNLYLKFTGNYYHLAEVEFKINGKYVVPLQYSKYYHLIKFFDGYFPRGINKKNNKLLYQIGNVNDCDLVKFNRCFQKLLNDKEELIKKMKINHVNTKNV